MVEDQREAKGGNARRLTKELAKNLLRVREEKLSTQPFNLSLLL